MLYLPLLLLWLCRRLRWQMERWARSRRQAEVLLASAASSCAGSEA
jgi:hypothetical protein